MKKIFLSCIVMLFGSPFCTTFETANAAELSVMPSAPQLVKTLPLLASTQLEINAWKEISSTVYDVYVYLRENQCPDTLINEMAMFGRLMFNVSSHIDSYKATLATAQKLCHISNFLNIFLSPCTIIAPTQLEFLFSETRFALKELNNEFGKIRNALPQNLCQRCSICKQLLNDIDLGIKRQQQVLQQQQQVQQQEQDAA
jgi:hypothetical protein